MLKFIIACAILALISSVQTQNAYSQCGGVGWSGNRGCLPGLVCVFQTQWYHQCKPVSELYQIAPSYYFYQYVPEYGQCYGSGWPAYRTCAAGCTCTYQTQYYYVCRRLYKK